MKPKKCPLPIGCGVFTGGLEYFNHLKGHYLKLAAGFSYSKKNTLEHQLATVYDELSELYITEKNIPPLDFIQSELHSKTGQHANGSSGSKKQSAPVQSAQSAPVQSTQKTQPAPGSTVIPERNNQLPDPSRDNHGNLRVFNLQPTSKRLKGCLTNSDLDWDNLELDPTQSKVRLVVHEDWWEYLYMRPRINEQGIRVNREGNSMYLFEMINNIIIKPVEITKNTVRKYDYPASFTKIAAFIAKIYLEGRCPDAYSIRRMNGSLKFRDITGRWSTNTKMLCKILRSNLMDLCIIEQIYIYDTSLMPCEQQWREKTRISKGFNLDDWQNNLSLLNKSDYDTLLVQFLHDTILEYENTFNKEYPNKTIELSPSDFYLPDILTRDKYKENVAEFRD